jgi:hypothetical protein
MVATVKHLQRQQFEYILTRKFKSDAIGMFFGEMCQMMSGNFQGDAYSVITSFERIIMTGITYCSIEGNAMLEREKPKAYKLLMENRITKKRASLLLVFFTVFLYAGFGRIAFTGN